MLGRTIGERIAADYVVMAVALVCWSELASFQLVFVKYRTYETVSWNLFAVRHIIPPRPGAGR